MIFFIILAVIIPCLVLGCVVFLIGAAIPITRRFALSAALWCVALSPWILALIFGLVLAAVFFGLAKEAAGDRLLHLSPIQLPGWTPAASMVFGYALFAVAIIGSLVTATIAASLHQIAIRRLTLALFRLYVAAVSFGVGILSCVFSLTTLSASRTPRGYVLLLGSPLGLFASVMLAILCYRFADRFRGEYPSRFPVVSHEEFTSTTSAS